VLIKKFVKGQVDYSKATLKSILFGGGGAKIPEYRNKNDKPVFSDPIKVRTFVDFYLQSTTADEPTEENRTTDLRKMVESLVKLVAYYRKVLDAKPGRLRRDDQFLQDFHSLSHEQHCEFLERKRTSVFTMAFALQMILNGVGLFNLKSDAGVAVHDTSIFKGGLAIQEHVLLLNIAGQDVDRSHFKKQGPGPWFHEAQFAQRVVQVPGIDISQLDPKNQDALRFVNPILMNVRHDERPKRCKALTAKGAFKSKQFPSDFLFAPVFMDGWPTPLRLSPKGAAFGVFNMEADDRTSLADAGKAGVAENDDGTSADEAEEEEDDGF